MQEVLLYPSDLFWCSAAGQPTAGGEILEVFWLRVWRLVARNITFSMTCKAACQLMAVILEDGLVQYASITDIVDGLISSPELNGPSECDGAATRLWAILLHLRRLENLSSDFETPVKVLRWLFKRWSPGKPFDFLLFLETNTYNSKHS